MSILSHELAAVVREMGPGRCVLLMGASGSGKSTLAARLAAATGAVVVSYDSHQRLTDGDTGTEPVGERALAAAWAELDGHCAAGRLAIVDGTHCQPERRAAVRAIAAAHGMGTVVLVLRASLPVCLARQGLRQRQVPDTDVARQHAAVTASLPALVGEGHTAVLQLTADGL
ncbi:AAA family ATPase [Streptomyces sp. NPDC101175]|uniref:AAA family ATPase n=1 Tax=Streptomyces sp. NPDC101175 TaxID=3366123 RepID=UPI0038357D92